MGLSENNEERRGNQKPIEQMTLRELDEVLSRYAELIRFHGAGASERTEKNCNYIAFWCDMNIDEFRSRWQKARSEKKNIEIVSGAFTEEGAIRMPEDESGVTLSPLLYEVIKIQKERIARIDYAKNQELKEFDTKSLTRQLSTSG